MHKARRTFVITTFLIAVSLLILVSGPIATWLQRHDLAFSEDVRPNAFYLVAGASQQERRIDALREQLAHRSVRNSPIRPSFAEAAEGKPFAPAPFLLLVGNDAEAGKWSSEHERNLTAGEWAKAKLEHKLARKPLIVPGDFTGTDGEMEMLAEYLALNTEISSIALVTSGFHARRCVDRLGTYLDRDVAIYVVRSGSAWRNRAPWTVLGELLKMARDTCGLSRVPLLSREPLGSALNESA